MQWTIVISDIQARHGWTQPQIAKAAGCGQATISDLATGKTTEPRFGLGKVLLALRDKRPAELVDLHQQVLASAVAEV